MIVVGWLFVVCGRASVVVCLLFDRRARPVAFFSSRPGRFGVNSSRAPSRTRTVCRDTLLWLEFRSANGETLDAFLPSPPGHIDAHM